MKTSTLAFTVLALSLAGCARWQYLDHQINTAAVIDPYGEVTQLLASADRPISTQAQPHALVYYGRFGARTLTYAEMSEIALLTRRGRFVVDVLNPRGRRVLRVRMSNEGMARRLIDVLATLKQRAQTPQTVFAQPAAPRGY